MAEEGNGGPATAQAQPSLKIVSQYVKDLSFENPDAPKSLIPREAQPSINISVGVQARALSATETEVELKLEAKAKEGDKVLFALELVYGGLFKLENIPPENLQPLTLIECPRLIFPFARQIVAEVSRNGGFPPLMIDPIDFSSLYRKRMAEQEAEAAPPTSPTN